MQKIIIAAGLLLLASCKSNEIGNAKDVNPDAIYQEYSVSATEGDNIAIATAQFRFGGSNGTTLVLNDKSYVSLDGKKLKVDSSSMGAYYRTSLAMPGSAGEHNWKFTDVNEKSYSNKFKLELFTLINNFSSPIPKTSLELRFSGLKDNDEINLAINDTSNLKRYRDIDTTVKVMGGKVVISAGQIKKLAPGPLFIDISCFKDIPLREATKEGRSISYRFSLKKRNAILKNK